MTVGKKNYEKSWLQNKILSLKNTFFNFPKRLTKYTFCSLNITNFDPEKQIDIH